MVRPTPPTVTVTGYVQLSDDREVKVGNVNVPHAIDPPLFTDGPRLYFVEHPSGESVVTQLSVKGGDTVRLPVSVPQPLLFDLSPDRSQFL